VKKCRSELALSDVEGVNPEQASPFMMGSRRVDSQNLIRNSGILTRNTRGSKEKQVEESTKKSKLNKMVGGILLIYNRMLKSVDLLILGY
jgi:hypothetical protein